jgi:predicted AAA+ superfamily ATPase
VSYPDKNIETLSNREIISSLSEGEMILNNKATGETCYIKKFLGYSEPGPGGGVPAFARDFTFESSGGRDFIVIEDAGSGFRKVESAWKNILENAEGNQNSIVIYNMASPLFDGELWDAFSQKKLLNRTILIINANALREEGVNISRKLSWDRTIADFITILAYSKHKSLDKCPHILVRFGLEGVMYYYHSIEKGKEKIRKALMFYIPDRCEDETTENIPGRMRGLSSAFTGFLAGEIVGAENTTDHMPGMIEKIVPAAAEKLIQLLKEGYKKEGNRLYYPFRKVLSGESQGLVKTIDLRDLNTGYLEDSRMRWSILSHRIPRDFDLYNIARKYVLHGKVDELENVPVVKFGKLLTVDKNEIENFRSIKNLIKDYLDDSNTNKPLSIAIFGPPGSGKSFAVKSIVKSVLEKKTEILEYNLSQFESPLDIIRAFHEVRDYSLKGVTPLAFFDEFDSSFKNESLGWLKHFLAPMQDGEFKEGEKSHPIGRAIFIFAGGTNRSLKEFTRENESKKQKAEENTQHFIEAKGPDFVSRLKGYVNILGPNPINMDNHQDTAPRFDRFSIIRRAVLLRVILLQQCNIVDKDEDFKIRIDEDVLRALLLIPRYKHGARSINAVINMSMLNGRNRYEKAALPSPDQLSLHVDSDIFINILERDLIINAALIDRTIHEIYRDTQRNMPDPKNETHPSMADWDNLSEELRQNNRMLAENIPLKLLLINCSYRPKPRMPDQENQLIEFDEEEIDYLARMAHERWLEKKVASGWTYGKPRSDKEKIHDCIVQWEELPEELQRVDRNTIKSIPHMFDTAGFEVYRLDEQTK